MLTYGTIIKVIAGFYMGCTGTVNNVSVYKGDYIVTLNCKVKILRFDSTKKEETIDRLTDIKLNETEIEVIK